MEKNLKLFLLWNLTKLHIYFYISIRNGLIINKIDLQDSYIEIKEEYSKAMDLNDLKDLELGESIDFDDGVILCLSKFENPNSGVKDILYSYSELLLVDD